jgi:hypothetical protein
MPLAALLVAQGGDGIETGGVQRGRGRQRAETVKAIAVITVPR